MSPRRVLPPVILVTVFGVLTFSFLTPTLPDLADAVGVSRGAIGLVQSVVGVPGIFLAVVLGHLVDRLGRRTMGRAGLLLYGLAGSAPFVFRSFPLILAFRALQGVGTSLLLSLAVVVIGDTFPPGEERRRALGMNAAALTVTGLVSPTLGGLAAEVEPFLPFLLFALAVPAAAFVGRFPGRPAVAPPSPGVHLREMFDGLRRRGRLGDFLGLLPVSTLTMAAVIGFAFNATPIHLEAAFGLGAAVRGVVIASISLGSMVGSLTVVRLTGRLGPARGLGIAFTTGTAGFVVMAVAPSVAVFVAGGVLVGLALGWTFPVLQDFVASVVPGAQRGVAVGTWISSIRLGQSVGPILGTMIVTAAGGRVAYGVAAAVLGAVAVGWRPLRALVTRVPTSA